MKFSISGSVIVLALVLSGCNVQIDVPEGGRVVSQSGAYVCESGQSCVISVVDIHFDETFMAMPEPGYKFMGWENHPGRPAFCGGSAEACRLSTAGFDENEELMQVLESNQTWHLVPVFELMTWDNGTYL